MADLVGGDRAEPLTGTAGADLISGRGAGDTLEGGGGDDVIYGFGAEDLDPASGLITATRVASGLAAPVFAVAAPGEPDRLYFVELNSGVIRSLDVSTGQLSSTPFLDIPDGSFSTGGERGVLGLAFHPQYQTNGRLFVYLTNPSGDIEVREYARPTGGGEPQVLRTVLTIPHREFSNHNGGWMDFGADGLLYIATGDGGGGGDPLGNGQNINSLLGKILRIDVNRDDFPADAARNYGIPAANPFVGVNGADEVYAYGLRNPFRNSFDRGTGDLWIADVGQGQREEVNRLIAGTPGGVNFGWRRFEGNVLFDLNTPAPGAVAALIDYTHGSGLLQGRSVTGGYVYRGEGGLTGQYVFGDFVSGRLFSVTADGQAFIDRTAQLRVDAGDVDQIVSFALDGRGRLYVVGIDGDVHRLTPSAAAADAGDVISGGDGGDRLYGGAGDDRLDGGLGVDQLFGGIGDDFAAGQAGDDTLRGADGLDALFGNSGTDLILGEAGDDYLDGQEDGDFMLGGAGADRMLGGSGADLLGGEDGADVLTGGDGDDTLYGAGANDVQFGEAGADFLSGGDGDDILGGNGGADRLNGGPGNDRYVFFTGDGADRIEDFASSFDKIDVSAIDANSAVAGDQAFSYRGFSSTPTGAGTLHIGFVGGVGIFLFGYTDGDANPDVVINVGTFNLTAADLIL